MDGTKQCNVTSCNIFLLKIPIKNLYLDRSLYDTAKSSVVHAGDSNLGPSVAIDDAVNSNTAEKNGAFMSGGGGGITKLYRGWLEVSLTEPVAIMGFEITSTAWENLNNNPDGILKARIINSSF